jgi:hypothetical protein
MHAAGCFVVAAVLRPWGVTPARIRMTRGRGVTPAGSRSGSDARGRAGSVDRMGIKLSRPVVACPNQPRGKDRVVSKRSLNGKELTTSHFELRRCRSQTCESPNPCYPNDKGKLFCFGHLEEKRLLFCNFDNCTERLKLYGGSKRQNTAPERKPNPPSLVAPHKWEGADHIPL